MYAIYIIYAYIGVVWRVNVGIPYMDMECMGMATQARHADCAGAASSQLDDPIDGRWPAPLMSASVT